MGHKINLKYVLKNVQGEALTNAAKTPLTALMVIQECLLADAPGVTYTSEEKVRSGYLAYKKLFEDDPELTTEELALIEKRCNSACTTAAWFQIKGILDGKPDPLCD